MNNKDGTTDEIFNDHWEKSIARCKFCRELPEWEELPSNHRWRNNRYAKWDGWLTHYCESNHYQLVGTKKHTYQDWNRYSCNQ